MPAQGLSTVSLAEVVVAVADLGGATSVDSDGVEWMWLEGDRRRWPGVASTAATHSVSTEHELSAGCAPIVAGWPMGGVACTTIF